MNPIKDAVNVPEHLVGFIEVGIDLYRKQASGARFGRDELSAGEWACLHGAIEGTNRARNEKIEAEQRQAELRAKQRQTR